MAGHGLSHPPFLSLSDGFIEIIEDESGMEQIFGTFGDHRMGYNGCVSNGVDGSNSFIAGLSDKSQRPLHL